ncbi:MAG: hypothetical protein HC765_15085 [Brachymonas sp.]|nr:hypothetical protein [Brachymonas sp.]
MPASGCFDDKKLAELQAGSSQAALVYVWSPRMVYSVQQISVAQRAATSLGLNFIAVHDARIAPQEIAAAHPSINSAPLCAEKLLHQEALRHFPISFILTAQGIHRHPIIGAMPDTAWHSSIAQRLQKP